MTISKGNGKVRKKRKKNPPHKKVGLTENDIKKAAIKADGSCTEMAKELDVTPQTAHKHLKKEIIQEALLDARERAMKKVGMTRERVYKRAVEGLDATKVISANIIVTKSDDPTVEEQEAHSRTKDFIEVNDYKERREAAKLCMQLMGDLKFDFAPVAAETIIFMPNIVVGKQELLFDVGETIDVGKD